MTSNLQIPLRKTARKETIFKKKVSMQFYLENSVKERVIKKKFSVYFKHLFLHDFVKNFPKRAGFDVFYSALTRNSANNIC